MSLAAAALLAAAGCAGRMNVTAYGERGMDVARYRTFAWAAPDGRSTGDPRLDNNRFFDERVRAGVEAQLARRGFEKLGVVGTPDLLVHYHASVTQEIDTRDLDREYGCPREDCRPFVYDAGSILIDLVDPSTNRLVWRGWAKGSIDGVIDRQDLMEREVDNAVAKIFARLPTRS